MDTTLESAAPTETNATPRNLTDKQKAEVIGQMLYVGVLACMANPALRGFALGAVAGGVAMKLAGSKRRRRRVTVRKARAVRRSCT